MVEGKAGAAEWVIGMCGLMVFALIRSRRTWRLKGETIAWAALCVCVCVSTLDPGGDSLGGTLLTFGNSCWPFLSSGLHFAGVTEQTSCGQLSSRCSLRPCLCEEPGLAVIPRPEVSSYVSNVHVRSAQLTGRCACARGMRRWWRFGAPRGPVNLNRTIEFLDWKEDHQCWVLGSDPVQSFRYSAWDWGHLVVQSLLISFWCEIWSSYRESDTVSINTKNHRLTHLYPWSIRSI